MKPGKERPKLASRFKKISSARKYLKGRFKLGKRFPLTEVI